MPTTFIIRWMLHVSRRGRGKREGKGRRAGWAVRPTGCISQWYSTSPVSTLENTRSSPRACSQHRDATRHDTTRHDTTRTTTNRCDRAPPPPSPPPPPPPPPSSPRHQQQQQVVGCMLPRGQRGSRAKVADVACAQRRAGERRLFICLFVCLPPLPPTNPMLLGRGLLSCCAWRGLWAQR